MGVIAFAEPLYNTYIIVASELYALDIDKLTWVEVGFSNNFLIDERVIQN